MLSLQVKGWLSFFVTMSQSWKITKPESQSEKFHWHRFDDTGPLVPAGEPDSEPRPVQVHQENGIPLCDTEEDGDEDQSEAIELGNLQSLAN